MFLWDCVKQRLPDAHKVTTEIHPDDEVIHLASSIGAFREPIISGSEYLGIDDGQEHSTSLLSKLADAIGI